MAKVAMIQGIDDGFLGAEGWGDTEPFYGFVDADTQKTLIIDSHGLGYYEYDPQNKTDDRWVIDIELTYEQAQAIIDKFNSYTNIEPVLYMIKTLGKHNFG